VEIHDNSTTDFAIYNYDPNFNEIFDLLKKGYHFSVNNTSDVKYTGFSKYDHEKFKMMHTRRSGQAFPWGKGTITFKNVPQYKYIGCFNDHSHKGKTRPLDYISRIDKTNPNEIKNECMKQAKDKGKDMFAIQDRNACMVGDSKTSPYSRDGASTTCTKDKLGTPWVNAVFKM
jgi:hypothetical protein